jgi:hypothetical protein
MMSEFDLRQYLKENKLGTCQSLKEELEYSFSEYDYEPDEEFVNEVVKRVKGVYGDNIPSEEILQFIEDTSDYFYREARNEGKRGREYPSTTVSEFSDMVIEELEDGYDKLN